MIYNSVAEIYDRIDGTRLRLTERVANLTSAQENFRPAASSWSVAQIVEHLSIFEDRLSRLFGMMIKKSEGAEAVGGDHGQGFRPFSLDRYIEQSRKEKYTAPETVAPSGNLTLADALAKLEGSRASLHELRSQLETRDLSAATYPHPAFGPLNLYQWLAFVGLHEERHLRQIEKLIESAEFKEQ